MNSRYSLLLVLSWLVAQGCSSSESSNASFSSNPCPGANCRAGAQTKDTYELTLATAGAGFAGTAAGGDATVLPTLCAVQNPSCDPDDATSCSYALPTVGQGGTTGSTGSAGSGVQLPSDIVQASAGMAGSAAGLGDAPDTVATGGSDLGASGSGGKSGGGAAASNAGAVGVAMACRVKRDQLVARTTCEPAGQGTLGAPCVSRANCAAGFACVEENGTAQCRPYCCRGVKSCPIGTYCDQRFTKELVTTAERLSVSVCMPAVNCRFDDPFPCPTDRTCSCPSGKACAVVRADGTTACVAPGTGVEGQPCPCAAGRVCADALGSCFKVCSLTSSDPDCVDGFCQASASLPAEWGICVNSASLL